MRLKINSLELEGLQKQAQVDKFQRIVINMTAEIKKLKSEGKGDTNSEIKGKVKKLGDEVKDKNKKIAEKEAKVTDLLKSLVRKPT